MILFCLLGSHIENEEQPMCKQETALMNQSNGCFITLLIDPGPAIPHVFVYLLQRSKYSLISVAPQLHASVGNGIRSGSRLFLQNWDSDGVLGQPRAPRLFLKEEDSGGFCDEGRRLPLADFLITCFLPHSWPAMARSRQTKKKQKNNK